MLYGSSSIFYVLDCSVVYRYKRKENSSRHPLPVCVCVCGPHTPVCVAGHRLLLFGRAPRQSTLVLGSEIWALDASAAVKLMLRLIV